MKSFSEFIEDKKQLIIMRGISGSGKSTIAKTLVGKGKIFSTDDFFMQGDKYFFDPKKIGLNHKLNQERTEEAMKQGVTPIVIDNTNDELWEMKPYVTLADKYGYEATIKEIKTPDIEEIMRRQESRKEINKSVPRGYIEKKIARYRPRATIDDVRNS